MPENFETWGDAMDYCKKYGLVAVRDMNDFDLAEGLLRAYNDGRKDRELELERQILERLSEHEKGMRNREGQTHLSSPAYPNASDVKK